LLHKSKASLLFTACRTTGHSRYVAFRRIEVAEFSLYFDVVLLSHVGLQKNKCYQWWYQARPASRFQGHMTSGAWEVMGLSHLKINVLKIGTCKSSFFASPDWHPLPST
jgi:hypothetical protein